MCLDFVDLHLVHFLFVFVVICTACAFCGSTSISFDFLLMTISFDLTQSPSRQLHAGVRSCKGNFFFRPFGRTRFSACCGVVSLSVLGPYRWCLSLALGAALAFCSSFRELFVRFLAGFFECATEKVGQARLSSLFRLQFGLFLNRGGVVGLTYVPSRRILLFPS